jgi:hypothetical protein
MGREPSLHSLDIDGIIQSFVREQENSHSAHVGPAGRVNSSDAAAPMQSLWPYAPTDMPSVALAGQNDADTSPYDNNGSWVFSGQQPMFAQDPVNVDDLLYGFNGSALDSFPVLDWDTM